MSTLQDHESLRRTDERRLLHAFSALRTQPGRDVLVVREAQGLVLTDDRGQQFTDAGSGLWCSNVGYGRAEIVRAAAAQMADVSFSHNFNVLTSEPLIQLSERLVALAPPGFERVLYAIRSQRRPGQAGVALPPRAWQAVQEEDHLAQGRLPRRDGDGRQPDRPGRDAPRFPHAAGLRASCRSRRIAPEAGELGRRRGGVLAPSRRAAGPHDPGRG